MEDSEAKRLRRLAVDIFSVRSATRNVNYTVNRIKKGNRFVCDCEDHMYRHNPRCEHIALVQKSLKEAEEARTSKEKTLVLKRRSKISACPYCGSKDIKKFGVRHNKLHDVQKLNCKDCRRTFSDNLGFEKMRFSPQTITEALQLFFSGESLRNIEKYFKLQGIIVSHKTVYMWIVKYTKVMKQFIDREVTPNVGDVWRADEVYLKIRGELKYVFSLMDDETRFWIAQEIADRKQDHDARGLLKEGKRVSRTIPNVFITDGLRSYNEAYRREFWARSRHKRPVHIQHIHLQGDMNNNRMERFNGEFRDREKVFRGIKTTDSVIVDGLQIYHNYIRPHMSLDGKTPADMCGIEVQGKNKWLTMIENASYET